MMSLPSLQTWLAGQIRAATLSLTSTFTSALATKQDVAQRGVSSGYASLDAAGKVPPAELPDFGLISGAPVIWADDPPEGPMGPPGPAGTAGAQGIQGPPGADGQDGADGAPGAPGAAGPAGVQGRHGVDGADGADGLMGPTGAAGATGAPGLPLFICGDDGAEGSVGPPGAPGAPGSSYLGFAHDGSLYTARKLLSCATNVGLASFGAMTLNRYYVVAGEAPDSLPQPLLVTVGCEVTTAVAASFIYFDVYSYRNGYADRLLASIKKSSAATGFVEDVVNVRMSPGQRFFVCIGADTAGITIRGVGVNSQAAVYGRGAAGATDHISYLYNDAVSLVAAPDPFPNPTGQVTGSAIPAVHGIWST